LLEAGPEDSSTTEKGNGGLAVIPITPPPSDDSVPPGVVESCDKNEQERQDGKDANSTPGDNIRFDFGKHIGRTYREVASHHPDYGVWALRQSYPSPQLARFCAWYHSHGHRDIITDRASGGSNDNVGRSPHLVVNEADIPGTARQLFPSPASGRGNNWDRLNGNDLLGFGKHSHRTYDEVAVHHADYLVWALGVSNPSPKLARFCQWYRMNNTNDNNTMNWDRLNGNDLVGFGKHSHRTYNEVAVHNADYLVWALGVTNPSPKLARFCRWHRTNNTNDNNTMNRSGVRFDTLFDTPNIARVAVASTFDRVATTTTMGFGKYKRLTYGQVAEQDPGYCRWALEVDHPSSALRKFRDWLILSNNI
jgi:uncharacterized protein (DUF3820 family)